MAKPTLIAVLACLASPAVAQTPDEAYGEAVAARQAGDFERAITLLEGVVRVEPDNADALLQLGLALLAQGRLDEAEANFRRTLALAPGYTDASVGLARVAQRRGDLDEARRILAGADQTYPDVRDLSRQLVRARTRAWSVDVDAAHSELDGGRPDWNELTAHVAHRFGSAMTAAAAVHWADRFDRTDTYAEARIEHREAGGPMFYIAFGATPKAEFLPEWQISAGASLRVAGERDATIVEVDGRAAEYPTDEVATLNLGFEQYMLGGRAWLTGRLINIFDGQGHHAGWFVRGDALVTARLRLFAGTSDAPDTSEGVVTEVSAVFGGVAWDVSDGLTLRASVAHEDRASGYERVEYAIGLGTRF